MEKLKQGKMDRKSYWIAMAVLCLLIIMLPVAGNALGYNGRVAVGIIAIVIIAVSAVMRLRDAGKSMVHLLLVFIIPGYMYAIGFFKSEELHRFVEPEGTSDMGSMNSADRW